MKSSIFYPTLMIFFSLLSCAKMTDVQSSEKQKTEAKDTFMIQSKIDGYHFIEVVTIDSCEYIFRHGSKGNFEHKGNCKFCKAGESNESCKIN